jgi:hypothetical protein
VVVARDTTPPAPRVDMEALRAAAARDLNGGIQRFAQAVAGRQVAEVAGLFAPGEAKSRERFVQFLKESAPTSTLQATEPVSITETQAEAAFTLLLKWRGDFGVEKKKAVRFQASTGRRGDEWTFAGVRLLENFP